jgi:hypothetical protein
MNRKLPEGQMYVVDFNNELHVIAESPEQAKELARKWFVESLTTDGDFTKQFQMKARLREPDYVEKWTEQKKEEMMDDRCPTCTEGKSMGEYAYGGKEPCDDCLLEIDKKNHPELYNQITEPQS